MTRKLKSYDAWAAQQPPSQSSANVIPVTAVTANGGLAVVIEYDINDITSMPATDGQSEVVPLRVPANALRLMQIIRESADTPFKTNSDLTRAALFDFFNRNPHGLRFAHTKEYRALMRLCAMHKEQQIVERMEQLITETYAYIGKCVSKKHTSSAKKAIQQLLEAIMDLEPGEWRSGFLDHVKGTWGHLIQQCVVRAGVGGGDVPEEEEYEGDGD